MTSENPKGSNTNGAAAVACTDLLGPPPCECGSPDAHWHGDRRGLRVYMCDKCAKENLYVQSEHTRGEGWHHWAEYRGIGTDGRRKTRALTDWTSKGRAMRALAKLQRPNETGQARREQPET